MTEHASGVLGGMGAAGLVNNGGNLWPQHIAMGQANQPF